MQDRAVVIMILIYLTNITANQDNAFHGFKFPCMDTSPRCLKDSFQAVFPDFVRGIPALGIAPLDPLKVDKINLAMTGGLEIEFKEGQTKGLRKCVIDSASFVKENQYKVILHCNFTIKGKYRSYGRMLMFPIDGEGDATIICKNLKIECSFSLDVADRGGKKYLQLKQYDVRHSYEGQVFYKITNLFKGNPKINDNHWNWKNLKRKFSSYIPHVDPTEIVFILASKIIDLNPRIVVLFIVAIGTGTMVLEFMNQNWLAVASEFGDPIVHFGLKSVLNNVDKLLKTVPVQELYAKKL